MPIMNTGINMLLGLNSLTLSLLFAVMSILFALIFTAKDKDKGYLTGLIVFPFFNLLAVIVLDLWGMDFTINGILFFVGLVLMSMGIFINRNSEALLA